MLDIQFIRDNKKLVKEKSKQKGYAVDIDRLLQLDVDRRTHLSQAEELRQQRNELALLLKNQTPTKGQIETGRQLREKLSELEEKLRSIEARYLELLRQVPNMPSEDVPVGASESENMVVREWGVKRTFSFSPQTHWELADKKDLIDKQRAAKVTGSRFAYLKGDLVRLQWALMQFALDRITDEKFIQALIKKNHLQLTNKPFVPVLPPLMIRTDVYDAMDRLEPREDRYKIEGEELWLQGSAEHVLGSMHTNEVLEETQLPMRYAGYATSFRKEAGAYGKDMEGIVRLHQFDKLEMESLTTPETSYHEYLLMIAIQERLMQELELPYRLLNKCTADIGKPNARGWDIEVWLPGQDKYLETHTADYMTDYQARRLKTRVRRSNGDITLVHTCDATVFSQRPLVAIIENYQTGQGDIMVPTALRPYMTGKEII